MAKAYPINQCNILIMYLVNCYDENSNYFRIGNDVVLYFSLLDILHIMGLPIEGCP